MNEKTVIRRLPTGVPGLDAILGGGLPEYSFNIIITPGGRQETHGSAGYPALAIVNSRTQRMHLPPVAKKWLLPTNMARTGAVGTLTDVKVSRSGAGPSDRARMIRVPGS